MPKFHISILLLKANNTPGTQFQLVVEAGNYVDALEAAKPQLILELKESGLTVVDTPLPTPASPPVA
jgi:hypothetical protein